MSSLNPLSRGPDRYLDFNDKFTRYQFAETQRRILETVAQNRRTLIISGNGVGKSWIVAYLMLAFVYSNEDSTALGTSGSYSQFIDTMWRPLLSMHKDLKRIGLPGDPKGGNAPRLEVDDDWYAKVVSPRDPGDIEGRHANTVLVVIEEADKKYITDDHFESAGSSVTDASDRMVAVANPPKDESDVVYDKMQSNRWETIQFSSFDSHNVQYDIGNEDDYIPGLVDLPTMADDWEDWVSEPWPKAPETYESEHGESYPGIAELIDRQERGEFTREEVVHLLRPGFDVARNAHINRNDLDERWYRRRAGIIPPADASVHRPFYVDTVDQAVDINAEPQNIGHPVAVGIDVARKGGDSTVMAALYPHAVEFHDWKGVDHTENKTRIDNLMRTLPGPEPSISIDAVGEGSALADNLRDDYEITRFKAGQKAVQESEYDNKWTEALAALGARLDDMYLGDQPDNILEELYVGARTVSYTETRRKSGDVLKATPKSEIKTRLGRSPDFLDALAMACHEADVDTVSQTNWTW